MNKLSRMPSMNSFRRVIEQKRTPKSLYIDLSSFFKLQVVFICLFCIHNLIYNIISPNDTSVYVSSAVALAVQFILVFLWKKRKYLSSIFVIASLGIYDWAHIEFMRAEDNIQGPEIYLIKSLPLTVLNLLIIQNLTHLVHKAVAFGMWVAVTVVVTVDNDMPYFLPLFFITLFFVLANFVLVRKKIDGAANNEQKLARTVEKLKSLLDMHINDGIVVLDVRIKDVLFTNGGFRKMFERREVNSTAELARNVSADFTRNDFKYILNKILIDEEGARKDEPVYLWELLEVLRGHFVQESYETSCKYQIETGEYKNFQVKIWQTMWDFKKSFVVVFTDVSQQEVLKQLKANEENQDHMLDIFAHELRTPVKNILGALDFLVREISKVEDKNSVNLKYIQICQLSCKYLQSISNTFLDIARFKHRGIKINVVAFSIGKLIQDVKEMLECQTTGRNLKFEVEVAPDVPDTVVNDRDKLEQILLNLATNAIKFTFSGYIKIQAKLDGQYPDSIEISVVDTGTGIRKSDREKLFQFFSLLRNDNVPNADGAGLGLSISQKLARALAENDDERGIRVDSLLGRGSKFTFSITSYKNNQNCFVDFQPPMLPDERLPESVPKSVQKLKTSVKPPKLLQSLVSHQNIDLLIHGNEGITPSIVQSLNPSSFQDTYTEQADDIHAHTHTHLAPSPTHLSASQPCLLVVDDNPVDLMLMAQQLDAMNVFYKTAISGENCLEKVDESVKSGQAFRGILLDCYMPEMDGFQTAKILKARMGRKELPEIPIFAISAHDNQENREQAYKAGMVAWYSKPLKKEDVQEISENFLKVKSLTNRKSEGENRIFLKTHS